MTTNPQTVTNHTFLELNRAIIRLYIPQGSRQAFINAGWSGFNIVEVPVIAGMTSGPMVERTMSLDHRILGHDNISWSSTTGGVLTPLSSIRSINFRPTQSGSITLRVTVDGTTFTQIINVEACRCNPNPNIIQRCCCSDVWGATCPNLGGFRPFNNQQVSRCC